MRATGGIGVLIAVVSGCTPAMPVVREDLSRSLQERTGAGLGDDHTEPVLPETIDLSDGLTEPEAIQLALVNNANLQVTLTQLGFARADLYRAGALPNPVFSLFLPLGPKQLEMLIGWGIDWLWKRPMRVRIASLDVERTAESLVASGLDTVQQVEIGLAELHVARRRSALLDSTSIVWERMAGLALSRHDAGAASLIELTAVRSDARSAGLDAMRQQDAVRIAEAGLRELLNVPESAGVKMPELVVVPPALTSTVPSLADLQKRALAFRPEIRAAELAIEAAGRRGGLAIAEIFDFMVMLDANGRGLNERFEAGPAFQLRLPIFDQNQEGRARAEAEMKRAAWQYLASSRQVEREVAVAYHQWHRAYRALEVWPQDVARPLQDNVVRVEKAYRAGGSNYLEVLDATRRSIAAQVTELDLEIEARRAFAALQRSVGGRINATN